MFPLNITNKCVYKMTDSKTLIADKSKILDLPVIKLAKFTLSPEFKICYHRFYPQQIVIETIYHSSVEIKYITPGPWTNNLPIRILLTKPLDQKDNTLELHKFYSLAAENKTFYDSLGSNGQKKLKGFGYRTLCTTLLIMLDLKLINMDTMIKLSASGSTWVSKPTITFSEAELVHLRNLARSTDSDIKDEESDKFIKGEISGTTALVNYYKSIGFTITENYTIAEQLALHERVLRMHGTVKSVLSKYKPS